MTELPGYSEQPICVRRLGHPEESVPPENPFAVDFARNCQTAIANLRRRIAERGELPTNENDRGYIDPVTRILISGEGDRTLVAMRNKFFVALLTLISVACADNITAINNSK